MKTFLFQGDSITDCGRSRDNDNWPGSGYPLLVEAALGTDAPGEYRFVNRGVSGDKIDDVCARLQADILDVAPDYMSLLIGVNDVWHRLDRGDPIDKAAYEKSYDELLQNIRATLPQTKLFLLEPFILRAAATDDRPDMPDRYNAFLAHMRDFAAVVKRLAEKYNLTFVELQRAFDEAAEKAEPSYWLADGVHPTVKGHELIKRELLKAFQAF